MAFQKTAAAPLAELQNLMNGVAKNIVDKVYGPDGPAWGSRFSDLEEVAVQVGQAVARRMLDQALQRQAAAAVPAAD